MDPGELGDGDGDAGCRLVAQGVGNWKCWYPDDGSWYTDPTGLVTMHKGVGCDTVIQRT